VIFIAINCSYGKTKQNNAKQNKTKPMSSGQRVLGHKNKQREIKVKR
jgi:hypothetical protein